MYSSFRVLLMLIVLFAVSLLSQAQDVIAQTDSILTSSNIELPKDSLASKDSIPKKKTVLDAPVAYQAADSIVMTAGNWAYLFGEGSVKYQHIELQSEIIEMNMDSSLVYATYGLDSIGAEMGYPLFKEGEQQYESKTMRYNFKSKKGYITDVITQQGEGYVTSARTKKMEDDIMNMAGGRYTTCDEHDHPHFYIQMTRAKVRPKKNIVTGPVYLVIEDVPLYPLGLPFAFFPFSEKYSSGIIFPTFGDESHRGFFLREGGYYFAISDHVDLAVTGEVYTKGSWGLAAKSSYKKRYKYTGSFDGSYTVNKTEVAKDGVLTNSAVKDFKIRWTHSQDAKANPFRTLSASVNYATTGYDRNNITGMTGAGSTQNTKSSSVSLSQRFPNSPFSLSVTATVNQVTRDSSLAVTLPDFTATMSRIFPFKRKNSFGNEKWYEKISMSYTGYFRNNIQTKQDKFLESNLINDWQSSARHQIPISATFTAFKYINISPSISYNESWYKERMLEEYDMQQDKFVKSKTEYGFYRVYNYNTSLSASTTVYGMFKPLPFIPFLGSKVEAIRHKVVPTVSVSFAPDFGAPEYGFYRDNDYTNASGEYIKYSYSPYKDPPGKGKSGTVSFGLENNIEAKIKSDSDSTGVKKISVVDRLGFNMSYNMIADSFKWSNLNVGLRLKLTKSYSVNLNGVFDTYTYNEKGLRQNVTRWQAGKGIGRLQSTGTSFSYTFNNDTFKKLFGGGKDDPKANENEQDAMNQDDPDQFMTQNQEQDLVPDQTGGRLRKTKTDANDTDADGYWTNAFPWSFSFNYSMSLGYDRKKFNVDTREYAYALTHALSFSGNLQPTKNWRFNFNATYDFDNKKISYLTCNISRTLHCFNMTAGFIPVGPYKSYSFSIAVSSALLKDLKYDQRQNYRDGQSWY